MSIVGSARQSPVGFCTERTLVVKQERVSWSSEERDSLRRRTLCGRSEDVKHL